ncbi:MAG: uracil-DNA glycosylase family protein [Methyloceanibacter sp.]
MTATERKAVQALLDWYQAMGADEAIGEAPVDCFAPAAPPRPRPAPASAEPARPIRVSAPPPKTGPGADEARKAASLAELEALAQRFEGCALKRTAKSLCFSRGRDGARVMLIGEAPGRDEDLQGKPFVGRAGQLLDRMLHAIGLAEADIYITNTVYWRPPGNRTPTPEEVEACAPFLARQIELNAPDVLVLLGNAAAKSLLGLNEGIMRLRGKWLIYASGEREIAALATLHPAYLLRNPEAKRLAWRDMLALKERLEQT